MIQEEKKRKNGGNTSPKKSVDPRVEGKHALRKHR
jgi:hypothetical protein